LENSYCTIARNSEENFQKKVEVSILFTIKSHVSHEGWAVVRPTTVLWRVFSRIWTVIDGCTPIRLIAVTIAVISPAKFKAYQLYWNINVVILVKMECFKVGTKIVTVFSAQSSETGSVEMHMRIEE